jgi:hypothetical protein
MGLAMGGRPLCVFVAHDFAGDGIEMCGEAAEYNCFSVTVTISFVAYVFIMFKQDRPQGSSQGFKVRLMVKM